MTDKKRLVKKQAELLKIFGNYINTPKRVSYSSVCQDIRDIAEADFTLLNIREFDNKKVTKTIAVNTKSVAKNFSKLLNKVWQSKGVAHEAIKAKKLVKVKPTQFSTKEKELFTGYELYVHRLNFQSVTLGSIIIGYKKGTKPDFPKLVEHLLQQVSSLIHTKIYDLKKADQLCERAIKLTNQVPGVIVELQMFADGSYRFNYMSKNAEQRSGYSIEKILNNPDLLEQRQHPEDRKKVKKDFHRSAVTLKPMETEYRVFLPANKGKATWQKLVATPEKREDGSIIWYGHISDIAEQRKVTEKLRETSVHLEKLTNNVPGIIFELELNPQTHEQKYKYISRHAESFTGIHINELYKNPQSIYKFRHPTDQKRLELSFLKAAKTLETVNIEYREYLPQNNGEVTWRRTIAAPEKQKNGNVTFYGHITDIQETKKLQEKLLQAEREARRSSEYLALITNSLVSTIFELQRTACGRYKFAYISRAIERVTGYSAEEIKNDANLLFRLNYPDDRERFYSELEKSAKFLTPVDIEYRTVLPDTGITWSKLTAPAPEQLEDGTVKWYGHFESIHEQKQLYEQLEKAEKEAREFNNYLTKITNQVPGVIIEYQYFPNGYSHINYINGSVEWGTGVKADDLKLNANRVFDIIYEEDLPKINSVFNCIPKKLERVSIDCRYRNMLTRKLGWLNVEAEPELQADGSIIWYGYISNIQEYKDIEDKLRRSEQEAKTASEYFKKVVSQIPGAVLTIKMDKAGNSELMVFNDSSDFNSSYKLNDLFALVHPDDFPILIETLQHSQENLTPFSIELRVNFNDNKEQTQYSWYLLQATPEKDQDENLIYYAYLGQIDELKETQLQALKAKEAAEKASKDKTDFLSNMSHEIRTPMNAILGFSELLIGKTQSPKYEAYLDGIISGGKNLLMLINDVLDLAKIESGKMEIHYQPTDINAIAREFYNIYFQESLKKGITFLVDINVPETDLVMLDELRIRQILFNLISNAFKFTHSGEVCLIIGCNKKQNGFMELSFAVKDNGIGIPEDQQQLIFESFRQQEGQNVKKYGGTGLGLAITKYFTEAMKGKITLESKQGVGSTFTVSFPNVEVVQNDKQQKQQIDDVFKHVVFKNQKVLIVEDIISNLEVLVGFLEDRNLQIIHAENGKVALDYLKKELPDIILMDMTMPVMSGYEAVKIIKSNAAWKHIPIIAVTASVLKHSDLSVSEYCDNLLRKPVVKQELIVMLAQYLKHNMEGEETPAQLNINELQFQSEIKSDLRTKFMHNYEQVSELMSVDDIGNFASQLKKYSDKVNDKQLRSYAQTLLQHSENFEIDKMNVLFSQFKNLVN